MVTFFFANGHVVCQWPRSPFGFNLSMKELRVEGLGLRVSRRFTAGKGLGGLMQLRFQIGHVDGGTQASRR